MVNSPMTMARVRNAPLSSATRRFGRMTATMIREPAGAQALGGLGQAPDVDRPQAGVDRPVHVRERQDDVGGDEQDAAARCRCAVSGSGGWLNVLISPKTSTIGGMTNGSSVMNSTTGRSSGHPEPDPEGRRQHQRDADDDGDDADDERVDRGSRRTSRVWSGRSRRLERRLSDGLGAERLIEREAGSVAEQRQEEVRAPPIDEDDPPGERRGVRPSSLPPLGAALEAQVDEDRARP